MSNKEIRAALLDIDKYRELGYPIHVGRKSIKAALDWEYDYNEQHHITEDLVTEDYKKSRVPCYYSKTKFTFEGDGYVYPCFLTTDGSFIPKNWKEVGIESAIEHVRENNLCTACPALSQNDHNSLLGMNLKQVSWLVLDHLKDILRFKGSNS